MVKNFSLILILSLLSLYCGRNLDFFESKNRGLLSYKQLIDLSLKTQLTQTEKLEYKSAVNSNIYGILKSFTEDDIKQWDGLNVDGSAFPSSLTHIPTFTLPTNYKGLSNFKVLFIGESALQDDEEGTYKYEVQVTNENESVKKTIFVLYRGFKNFQIVQIQNNQVQIQNNQIQIQNNQNLTLSQKNI